MEQSTVKLPFPMPESRDEHLHHLRQLLEHLSSLVSTYKSLGNFQELDPSVRDLMLDLVGNLPESQEGFGRSIAQMFQAFLQRAPVQTSDSTVPPAGSSPPQPNPTVPSFPAANVARSVADVAPVRSPISRHGSSSPKASSSSAAAVSTHSPAEDTIMPPLAGTTYLTIHLPGHPTALSPSQTSDDLPSLRKENRLRTEGDETVNRRMPRPDEQRPDNRHGQSEPGLNDPAPSPSMTMEEPALYQNETVGSNVSQSATGVDKGKKRARDVEEDFNVQESEMMTAKKIPLKTAKTFTALKRKLTTRTAAGHRPWDFRRAYADLLAAL